MSSDRNLEKYAISAKRAWKISKVWLKTSLVWQVVDHFLSIGSFAASVYTIYLVAEKTSSDTQIIALSSIAAVLTLMSFACNPGKYKTNYRIAFQILNAALIENTGDDGNFRENGRTKVEKAIILGEQYIGKTFDTDATMNYDDESNFNNHIKCSSGQDTV